MTTSSCPMRKSVYLHFNVPTRGWPHSPHVGLEAACIIRWNLEEGLVVFGMHDMRVMMCLVYLVLVRGSQYPQQTALLGWYFISSRGVRLLTMYAALCMYILWYYGSERRTVTQ